jgi:SAM-dependent methyltransferase
MPEQSENGAYYEGLNEALLRAVPDSAQTILEVGCANGRLGGHLKQIDHRRKVYGIERNAKAAESARRVLDEVFAIDVEEEDVPLDSGSVDCILYGDVLEHLIDPWEVLRKHRSLLSAGGRVLCSISNIQHHSVVAQILRGDFQYQDAGLLDQTHLRFFTFATAMKLLLDAGYAPDLIDTIDVAGGDPFIEASLPLLAQLRADPYRSARYLNTFQMILSGVPVPRRGKSSTQSVTFVACVNDEAQLEANLLRSPCLRASSQHQLLLFRDCATAAEGLNAGIEQAVNELVVLVHQDVYLPEEWPARLSEQWRHANQAHGSIGVAGLIGMQNREQAGSFVGRVVDRDHLLDFGDNSYPTDADLLDEMLLVVHRETPLRFDPRLGWHLYGVDLCLSALDQDLRVVVFDALCYHNSLTGDQLESAYRDSEDVLARKWLNMLPIFAPCSVIEAESTALRMSELEGSLDDAIREIEHLRSELIEVEGSANQKVLEKEAQIQSMEASTVWRVRNAYASMRERIHRR